MLLNSTDDSGEGGGVWRVLKEIDCFFFQTLFFPLGEDVLILVLGKGEL